MRGKGRRVIQLAGGREELSRQSGRVFITGPKRASEEELGEKKRVGNVGPPWIWELLLGNAYA
jgi:hypothetical protein